MSKKTKQGSNMHKKVQQYFKKRHGASLDQQAAHQEEHQAWNRRDFLRMSGLAAMGSGMMLGGFPVSAFSASPLLNSLNTADCGDRTLVLIRLKGGNDGLNTVILRDNDIYYNIRPTLAIQENELWGLSPEYGMPTYTQALEPLWADGRMQVIHNVGYPNQNYSHFRSSDIWASASDSNEVVKTGWMGRWLENAYPAFTEAPPVIPPALQIGVESNLVFRGPESNMALSVSNPQEFYQIAQTGQLYNMDLLTNSAPDQELGYVRSMANSAFRYSESIQQAYNNGSNTGDYPNNYLAEQLQIVARMIKGNLGTKVYMVTIGGFDTHAQQANYHPALLNALANSVKAFIDDLDLTGHSENVLCMTFSEFGRTIYQNGSDGTDHGTGAPVLLFGNDLGSTFIGSEPDLSNLNQYGDPEFTTDFRSVYSTVLQDWLCLPTPETDFALGESFEYIEGLVPAGSPSIGSSDAAALIGHQANLEEPGVFNIKYAIKIGGETRIQILSKDGHPLRTILNEFKAKGSYTLSFNPLQYQLPNGEYIYRLQTGGKVYTKLIKW